mmetsp:Transcript_43260/g.85687  ORF Transcript_43260/g.85687 Transcript_43260/m.85687 type:complete len:85 (-) Transcript_43260:136-390(-)
MTFLMNLGNMSGNTGRVLATLSAIKVLTLAWLLHYVDESAALHLCSSPVEWPFIVLPSFGTSWRDSAANCCWSENWRPVISGCN